MSFAATADPVSLVLLRQRKPIAWSLAAAGGLSLLSTYVAPFAAALMQPALVQPLSVLTVPALRFPALRVPALPAEPAATRGVVVPAARKPILHTIADRRFWIPHHVTYVPVVTDVVRSPKQKSGHASTTGPAYGAVVSDSIGIVPTSLPGSAGSSSAAPTTAGAVDAQQKAATTALDPSPRAASGTAFELFSADQTQDTTPVTAGNAPAVSSDPAAVAAAAAPPLPPPPAPVLSANALSTPTGTTSVSSSPIASAGPSATGSVAAAPTISANAVVPPAAGPPGVGAGSASGTTAMTAGSDGSLTAAPASTSSAAGASELAPPLPVASATPPPGNSTTTPPTSTDTPSVPTGAGGARAPPVGTLVSATTGGTVTSADGKASLTFLAGQLQSDVYISITVTTATPAGVSTASPAYSLSATDALSGATVDQFGYGPLLTLVYVSASGNAPQVFYLDATGAAQPIDSIVDRGAGTVSAHLSHFSTYLAASTQARQYGVPVVEATVTGTVSGPDGVGVAGVVVNGTSDTGFHVQTATDPTGAFSVAVTRGLWTFSAAGAPNFKSSAVHQVDTTTTGFGPVTIALQAWAVYVTGLTEDQSSSPIAGVQVSNGYETVTSGTDGSFRIGGNAGPWYLSGVDLPAYYQASMESGYGLTTSHGVNLAVSADTTQNLVYTTLPRTVNGAVVDASVNGIAGVTITYDYRTVTTGWSNELTVSSGTSGSYSFGVPNDTNYVEAWLNDSVNGYGNATTSSVRTQPSSTVTTPIALASLTFGAHLPIAVTGTLTDGNGGAVAGAWLEGDSSGVSDHAYTDAAGHYTLYGNAGDWYVYVYDNTSGYRYATDSLAGLTTPSWTLLPGVTAAGATLDLAYIPAVVVTGTATKSGAGAAGGATFALNGQRRMTGTTNSLGELRTWVYADTTGNISATLDMTTHETGYYLPAEVTISGSADVSSELVYQPFDVPFSGTAVGSDGAQVAGAIVHLLSSDGDQTTAVIQSDGSWTVLGPVGDGSVRIDPIPGYGPGALVLYSGASVGVAVVIATITLYTPEQIADFQSGVPQVQATITGTVVGPDGTTPIAGAIVTATANGFTVHATTAPDGTFSLDATRSMWTLTATAFGFAPATIQVDTSGSLAPATLTLASWAITLTGVTRAADGTPIGGVTVSNQWESTTSDAVTGAFHIGGNAASWQLTGADLGAYYSAAVEGSYAASGDRHHVVLDFGAASGAVTKDLVYTPTPDLVTGLLVDGDGAGIAGASVQIQYLASAADSYDYRTVTTDADGRYTLGLPADADSVYVHAFAVNGASPSGDYWRNVPTPSSGSIFAADNILYTRYGTVVSGYVLDSNGHPLEGVVIRGSFEKRKRLRVHGDQLERRILACGPIRVRRRLRLRRFELRPQLARRADDAEHALRQRQPGQHARVRLHLPARRGPHRNGHEDRHGRGHHRPVRAR